MTNSIDFISFHFISFHFFIPFHFGRVALQQWLFLFSIAISISNSLYTE